MSEFEKTCDYSNRYNLGSDFLYYNSSEVMHPDPSSEAIGAEAACVVNALPYLNSTMVSPPKVLDAGIGSGIGLAACVSGSEIEAKLYGFDINPVAVQTAEHNMRRLIGLTSLPHEIEIIQADWHNSKDKEAVAARGPYDVILFNPPYLRGDTPLFPGYEDCPREAVYSDDDDGLNQYRLVLPWLAASLSEAVGASIIIRRPMSSDPTPIQTIGMIKEIGRRHIPHSERSPGVVSMSSVRGVSSEKRGLAVTILSRADRRSGLSPHRDPMINGAFTSN